LGFGLGWLQRKKSGKAALSTLQKKRDLPSWRKGGISQREHVGEGEKMMKARSRSMWEGESGDGRGLSFDGTETTVGSRDGGKGKE